MIVVMHIAQMESKGVMAPDWVDRATTSSLLRIGRDSYFSFPVNAAKEATCPIAKKYKPAKYIDFDLYNVIENPNPQFLLLLSLLLLLWNQETCVIVNHVELSA